MLELHVAALVLLAAALHATWNAIVKQSGQRELTFAVVVVSGLVYAPLLSFVAVPAREAWPFMAASLAIHLAYFVFLLRGYRYGDLSQVYPIARGTGPLLVAIAAQIFADEELGARGFAGVALVSVGVLSLISPATLRDPRGRRAAAFALATGVVIAGYTMFDGLGVRASGNAVGYVVWGNVLSSLLYPAFVFSRHRRQLRAFLPAHGARAFFGGLIAVAAYSIAMWAMSRTNLAYVAALRETSVILAAVLGTTLLGEPFGRRRIVASGIVAAGIVVLSVR